jgi:hypothetical protein
MIPNPANPQCLNRYSYCLNNPLRYVDPSGHTAEEEAALYQQAAELREMAGMLGQMAGQFALAYFYSVLAEQPVPQFLSMALILGSQASALAGTADLLEQTASLMYQARTAAERAAAEQAAADQRAENEEELADIGAIIGATALVVVEVVTWGPPLVEAFGGNPGPLSAQMQEHSQTGQLVCEVFIDLICVDLMQSGYSNNDLMSESLFDLAVDMGSSLVSATVQCIWPF